MKREKNNYLDILRLEHSINELKENFILLLQEDQRKAISFLNENSLGFPSFYLLIPVIDAYKLTSKLSWRNKLSIKIILSIQSDRSVDKINALSSAKKVVHVLQWMFQTGSLEDGLNDEYDQLMDDVVALLIINYGDHDILPDVANMIFRRNRKGLFLHDLVWSFFNSYNPITLKLVANYLESQDSIDIQFAHKLLHLELTKFSIQNVSPEVHEIYKNWLDENDAYLYFTDQSFQQTSNPIQCSLNIEAKYLHKKVLPDTGEPKRPLTPMEKNILQEFRKMPIVEKEYLSKYSHKMYEKDLHTWKKWIEKDIYEQIEYAKNDQGGY